MIFKIIFNKINRVLVFYQNSIFIIGVSLFLAFDANSNEINDFLNKYDELSVEQKYQWSAMLHFKGSKSIITDKNFFFSRIGNKNPRDEFKETVKSFLSKEKLDNNHSICRFPARYQWIYKNIGLLNSKFPNPKCQDYKNYIKNISPEKVKLVFASENVNNIISMMGHIFIKIEGVNGNKPVSHSLGYFAGFDEKSSPLTIFKSITFGIDGFYILEPYSKSIEKYNNDQKRSLWEYELEFTKEQNEILVNHIWEMKNISTKYQFISHNCGSAILYLLGIVDRIIADNHSNLDAPIDIVKNIKSLGYIKKAEILPADNYYFRMVEDNFSLNDKVLIQKIISGADLEIIKKYDKKRKFEILEGLKIALNHNLVSEKISRDFYEKTMILIDNESIDSLNNKLKYNVKNPLKKSKSSSFEFGYKKQGGDRDFTSFNFNPVYKDLMDNDSGYFNNFELKLANFEGGYYDKNQKLRIDNIDLIKVKNIIPYDYLVGGVSGGFKINLERQNFDSESNKLFPNLNIGSGFGVKISDEIVFYSLLNGGYSYFLSNNVFYLNPEIGLTIKESDFGKFNISYMKYFAENDYKYREILSLNQVFYFTENVNILISYKKVYSDLDLDFQSLGTSIKYNF